MTEYMATFLGHIKDLVLLENGKWLKGFLADEILPQTESDSSFPGNSGCSEEGGLEGSSLQVIAND